MEKERKKLIGNLIFLSIMLLLTILIPLGVSIWTK